MCEPKDQQFGFFTDLQAQLPKVFTPEMFVQAQIPRLITLKRTIKGNNVPYD